MEILSFIVLLEQVRRDTREQLKAARDALKLYKE